MMMVVVIIGVILVDSNVCDWLHVKRGKVQR